MNAKVINQVKDDEQLISSLFDQLEIDETELDMALEPTAAPALEDENSLIKICKKQTY